MKYSKDDDDLLTETLNSFLSDLKKNYNKTELNLQLFRFFFKYLLITFNNLLKLPKKKYITDVKSTKSM